MKDQNSTFVFLAGSCLTAALGGCASDAEAAPKPKPAKPNFIIIMADDMGYGDISCYGNPTIRTPNLDRMAQEGIRLTNFHTNGAASTPTRASLLTGRYQQRAGLQGVLLTWVAADLHRGLAQEEITFAEVLKNYGGYATALYGKWHLGTDNTYNPVHQGFDEFIGFKSGNVDYRNYYDTSGNADWWEGETLKASTTQGYLTELISAHSLDFVRRNKDRPFCLYVAHGCPHYPYQGPDDPGFRQPGVEQMHHAPREDRATAYKEMIEYMDRGIGQMLDLLAEEGLDRNTFVIFLSDNGPVEPGTTGGLRGEKGSFFEGGIRVPAILWMPGRVPANGTSDELVLSMDLFPTMLDMAGIDYRNADKPLDGTSFVPVIEGRSMPRRTIFWRQSNAKAVMQDGLKYIVTTDKEHVDTHYLFDLKKDPQEQTNLVDDYPDVVGRLQGALKVWENDLWRERQRTLKKR